MDRRSGEVEIATLDIPAIVETQPYGLLIAANVQAEYNDLEFPDIVEAHGKYSLT